MLLAILNTKTNRNFLTIDKPLAASQILKWLTGKTLTLSYLAVMVSGSGVTAGDPLLTSLQEEQC